MVLQDRRARIGEVFDHGSLHGIGVATLDPLVQLAMEAEFPGAAAGNVMLELPPSGGEERDDARNPPPQRRVFRRPRDQQVEAGRQPVHGLSAEEAVLHPREQPLHGH